MKKRMIERANGRTNNGVEYAVVMPTIGRPSLQVTLAGLAGQAHPPSAVVIVDDRPSDDAPLSAPADLTVRCRTRVIAGPSRGPAAARNLGWQVTGSPWVVFIDDDVEIPLDWSQGLLADLADAPATTGGVQAVVRVPLPDHRRPTDWERNTAGLTDARWITAEMAFRRGALAEVAGFDERFPRAYREDSDLALRLQEAGWSLDTVEGEAWDRVLTVNLLGTAAVVRAAVPQLRRVHGRVVTIGSTLGLRPAGDATAYCASKHGVVGFTRALAMELAGDVGVTMVVPGGMRTHLFDGRPEQYRPGPDADLMDPGDVANAVVTALGQPAGVEMREVIVTASTEPSWP